MKFVTHNLLCYTLVFIALTVLMKVGITAVLDARLYNLPWFIGGAYGVITFAIGWFFGKRDSRSLPLYDAGLRYNLATFVVFATVSEGWHALGWMSEYDSVWPWRVVEIVWAVFLAANFVTYLLVRKKTIRGIEKNDLFD